MIDLFVVKRLFVGFFKFLKRYCNSHDCCLGCKFRKNGGSCYLFQMPARYDIETIEDNIIGVILEEDARRRGKVK